MEEVSLFCLSSLFLFFFIIILYLSPFAYGLLTTRGEKEHVDVWRRWFRIGICEVEGGLHLRRVFPLLTVLNPDCVTVTSLWDRQKEKLNHP